MSTLEIFFFSVWKVDIFIQESGVNWKRHNDHLTDGLLELQPVNAKRQKKEHRNNSRVVFWLSEYGCQEEN